jgi:hypothetical protein
MDTASPYMDVWATIAAGFLSLVLVRALLHKLGSYAEFVGNVRDYRLLPESLAPAAAATAVVLEVVAAVGLIVPATRIPAALLAAGLLAGYGVAIAINLSRGRTAIDCGCGGGGQGISRMHVVRNVLLLLFAVPVVAYQGPAPTGLGISLAASGCVLALWLTFLVFDQLLGNRTHVVATTHSAL